MQCMHCIVYYLEINLVSIALRYWLAVNLIITNTSALCVYVLHFTLAGAKQYPLTILYMAWLCQEPIDTTYINLLTGKLI